MQLIAITSPVPVANEAAVINQLFAAGLPLLHLRKPEAAEQEIHLLLESIHSRYYPQISLHSGHHLAGRLGIQRLHFPEKLRAAQHASTWHQLAEQGFTVSTSVHQLPVPPSFGQQFRYVLYGPVFNSISKQGYESMVPADYRLTSQPVSVIAVGGITPDNIHRIKQMQFNGAALLGALWQQPDKAPDIIASLLPLCK
jgi:thiamine-phosphate pyrophosphorylase